MFGRFLLILVLGGVSACSGESPVALDSQLDPGGGVASAVCGDEFPGGFAKMSAHLRMDESLRALSGLESVSTCDDARAYVEARNYLESLKPVKAENALGDAFDEPLADQGSIEVQKIWNGTAVNGALPSQTAEGIVKLEIFEDGSGAGVGGCSGTFINPQHILTAAHCFPRTGRFTVRYSAPGLSARTQASCWAERNPAYQNGDRGTDITVLTLFSPEPWASQRSFRIYTGATIVGAQLKLYGYGVTTFEGTGAGTLRTGTGGAPITITSRTAGYFVANAYTTRACKGDSGGPAMRETNSFPIIWGTIQGHSSNRVNCPDRGNPMFYAKTTTNFAFIQGEMMFWGKQCSGFSDADGNYARCF